MINPMISLAMTLCRWRWVVSYCSFPNRQLQQRMWGCQACAHKYFITSYCGPLFYKTRNTCYLLCLSVYYMVMCSLILTWPPVCTRLQIIPNLPWQRSLVLPDVGWVGGVKNFPIKISNCSIYQSAESSLFPSHEGYWVRNGLSYYWRSPNSE